ncbi:hypothetical protein M9458_043783, partial [Cirrhinus mrigala]
IQPHHKDPYQTDLLRKSQFSVGDAVDSIRQASVHTIHLDTSSPATRGQSSNNSVAATRMQKPPSTIQKASISTSSNAPMTIPQQLVVPISIATWTGKAIVVTGASYTLIHEGLMKQLTSPDQLQTWSRGPFYLANGEAEIPLVWVNTTIRLHDQAFTIPAAVLSLKALAYAVVLV